MSTLLLEPDIAQAEAFLRMLDPRAETFCFQTLDDKRLPTGKPRDKAELRQTYHGSLLQHAAQLTRLNTRFNAAVYNVANKTDGRGRLASNIVEIRTGWADLDNGLPKTWLLHPSIIVQTSPGKYQPYWLIDGDISHGDFIGLLKNLTLTYGGDPGVNSVERILRVPGFWHQKGEPFQVRIIEATGRRYTVQEITTLHEPVIEQRKAEPIPEEIPESERNRTLISFAGRMRRAGASPQEIEASLQVMNLQRCQPPLDEKEVHKIANSSGKYAPGALVKEGAIKWPELNKDDIPFPHSIANVSAYLNHLGAVPWFNDFDGKYNIDGLEGHAELGEEALRAMRILAESYNFRVPKEAFTDYVLDLAYQDRRHPVREYLVSLTWDGTPRLRTWLTYYCGVTADAYTDTVGQLVLCAAVMRVRNPGCKFDYMVVLEGPQDIGKSSVWRILAGDAWFTDCLLIGADPKIVIETTRGRWIIEHAELDGMGQRDVERIKAFISRQEDSSRLAFGRQTASVPRQFILAGTTNNAAYLRDETGNRRFLPVKCGRIDLASLWRDRDQLWAEAVALCGKYRDMRLDLPKETKLLAIEAQTRRQLPDPLEDKLTAILPTHAAFVPSQEIMTALGLTKIDEQRRNNQQIARVMHKLGWQGHKRRDGSEPRNGYCKGGKWAVLHLWNPGTLEFIVDPDSDIAKYLQ